LNQEGGSQPRRTRGEKPDAKPGAKQESKQGAKPTGPKAGAGSKPGARPGGGRPRRRPQPARGKRYEKPDASQDERMAIYKNKYGEDSTKPEKKSVETPAEKEGLLKRVIKSFWKK
jgi:hypothetical protein